MTPVSADRADHQSAGNACPQPGRAAPDPALRARAAGPANSRRPPPAGSPRTRRPPSPGSRSPRHGYGAAHGRDEPSGAFPAAAARAASGSARGLVAARARHAAQDAFLVLGDVGALALALFGRTLVGVAALELLFVLARVVTLFSGHDAVLPTQPRGTYRPQTDGSPLW